MAKPRYYSHCPHCFFEGFSHESQADADRAVHNHVQLCEHNPENDPYSWRDSNNSQHRVKVGSGSSCPLVGVLLLSVPVSIIYLVTRFLG